MPWNQIIDSVSVVTGGRAGTVLLWLLTNAVGHLVPAEVKVGRVGLNHGRGPIKRTHLLIGAEICEQSDWEMSNRMSKLVAM